MVGPPSFGCTGDFIHSQANQTIQDWVRPQLRAPCPAVSTPSSRAVGPKPAQVPGMGQQPKSGRLEVTKWTSLSSFTFLTLQFCTSCQWAATWLNYDIHIPASLLFGGFIFQRLFQKAEESIICWKSCPSGLPFRDADVLYVWKEGREEIILVNYLLQVSFSVYIMIWRFLCNLEGWKKGKI